MLAAMAEADALIEISEVVHDYPEALVGAEVNLPASGDRLPTYAIDVRGWTIGRDDEVVAVELVADAAVVRTVSLDVERPHVAARFDVNPRIGFRGLVNALVLAPEFELEVVARTGQGRRARIAAVRGRRAKLAARRDEDTLQPLLVTTLGRTGSMLLLRLLEVHPEVLVIRPHRYEQRVAGYWTEVLLALTDPSSYMRQLAPAGSLDRPRWWLGDESPTPGFNLQHGLQRWLGSDAIGALAEVCRQRIDALYAEAAESAPRERPRYFAEKHTVRSAALTGELYPEAREVFLVRDFRDMVSSILAFNRQRGVRGFGEQAADDPLDYVDRLEGWAEGMVQSLARRGSRAQVLRYEDLVREPEATLEALLRYLEVDASEALVATMLDGLETQMPELGEHATSPNPLASIGRWHSDLDDELKRACERSFGRALEAFGYER
jgi:Sulfotransferase family